MNPLINSTSPCTSFSALASCLCTLHVLYTCENFASHWHSSCIRHRQTICHPTNLKWLGPVVLLKAEALFNQHTKYAYQVHFCLGRLYCTGLWMWQLSLAEAGFKPCTEQYISRAGELTMQLHMRPLLHLIVAVTELNYYICAPPSHCQTTE